MQMFGMVEENSPEVGNVLVNRMIKAGQTIHIPKGLQHFRYGSCCLGMCMYTVDLLSAVSAHSY